MVMNILCANNSCIISPNELLVSRCHLLLLIGVIWINNNNNNKKKQLLYTVLSPDYFTPFHLFYPRN